MLRLLPPKKYQITTPESSELLKKGLRQSAELNVEQRRDTEKLIIEIKYIFSRTPEEVEK